MVSSLKQLDRAKEISKSNLQYRRFYNSINPLDRKAYLEMLRKVGNNVLVKGKEISTKQGMDSKIVIKEGNIANEIVQLAKKEQCNLIIVGNKGLGATASFFIGSVSNKLANSSPCSVLIVK